MGELVDLLKQYVFDTGKMNQQWKAVFGAKSARVTVVL